MNNIKLKGNANYALKVVKITNLRELPNCDKIVGTLILGNHIIVSSDTKLDDVGVYFPVECAIDKDFLRVANLFSHSNLNEDESKRGFFDDSGRVKALRLRGFKSEGFFIDLDSFNSILSKLKLKAVPNDYTELFDTIDDFTLTKKFIPKTSSIIKNINSNKTKGFKSQKRLINSILEDGIFKFHKETPRLDNYLSSINMNDHINITYKIHGTSGIVARLHVDVSKTSLKHRFLSFISKIITGKDTYKLYKPLPISSSANVLRDINDTNNIWSLASKLLLPGVRNGYTIYYEIAGYDQNGKQIQKDYPYGCNPFESPYKIYIYRITYTEQDGNSIELSTSQISQYVNKEFSNLPNVTTVPLLYTGTPLLLVLQYCSENDIDFVSYTPELFQEAVKYYYNDHNCNICNNGQPEEGCVIRVENEKFTVFKQKSFRFLEKESKNLDKNVIDIESEN